MTIRLAEEADVESLSVLDRHVSKKELEIIIANHRILIGEDNGVLLGWLRWSLFWDNTPFLNMLFLLEGCRSRGYGRMMTACWEKRMKAEGYELVMTSSLSNEGAQHFYRKLGYVDSGALLLPGEPLEILFIKNL